MGRGKVFAIGDVHGCAEQLNELVEKIPLDKDSTLVFLGDYIDRGPDSKNVIDTIINLKKKVNVITLMGNHESMMIEFLRDPSSPLAGFFILNGGSATLASYSPEENRFTIPDRHKEFLNELKLYYQTDSHFFVHAGVPNIQLNRIDLNEHANDLLWLRKSFLDSNFKWSKTIVHGHTPVKSPYVSKQRVNLDTGCVFNGSLTAFEIYSEEIFQVKAKDPIPLTFLKDPAREPRVAKRFLGTIPVYIKNEHGQLDEFHTVNFNEFGLLIVDSQAEQRAFQVGQVLTGVIGSKKNQQLSFTGQVVRQQSRSDHMAYGVKMISELKPA